MNERADCHSELGALAILQGLSWGGVEISNIRKTNVPNNTERKYVSRLVRSWRELSNRLHRTIDFMKPPHFGHFDQWKFMYLRDVIDPGMDTN